MANLSDLIETLYNFAPEAPDPTLVRAYRDAARRFFYRTRAYRADATLTQGGTTSVYNLAPPTYTEAFDLSLVEYDGKRLRKSTAERMRYMHSDSNNAIRPGDPTSFRIAANNAMILAPDPGSDVSSRLYARVIVRPTTIAETLDDDMVFRHADALEYGALSLLLRQNREAWGDPSMAEYYRKLFEAEMEIQQSLAADGGQVGVPRRVRYGGI